MREWVNVMADWPPAAVDAVMADAAAPVAKRAAARVWLDAVSRACTAGGVPIAGAELDRICDRTEGRPKQSITAEIAVPGAVRILTPLTGAVAAAGADVGVADAAEAGEADGGDADDPAR